MTEHSDQPGRGPSGAQTAAGETIAVEAVIPADPARMALLRRIASAVAVSLDFDIDTVADMRMAVDQLGTMAVERSQPGGEVTFRIAGSIDAVTATASVPSGGGDPVDEEGFDWMVLEAITDSMSWAVEADRAGAPRLTLTFVMRPHRVGM